MNKPYAYIVPENTPIQIGGLSEEGFTPFKDEAIVRPDEALEIFPNDVIGVHEGFYIMEFHCICEHNCPNELGIVPIDLVVQVYKGSDE